MAYARISRTWADGSACEVEVAADESFPDAISQVAAEVARLDQAANEDAEDDTADFTAEFGD